MSFRKRIVLSFFINVVLYLSYLFVPCNGGGFISLCADGILQPLGLFIPFAMQFGLFFNFIDLDYYLMLNFPNFLQFLLIWGVVLSPFFVDKLIRLLSLVKREEKVVL